MSFCTNAEFINIVMPTVKIGDDLNWLIPVNSKSSRIHRVAVWKIARFFRREFHYDFVQYGHNGDDDDKDHAAYLWVPSNSILRGWRSHCIGACCFRKRNGGRMAMQWIWIHPFFRRTGLLRRAWPVFKERHGDFALEGPLSEAMKAFVASVNKPSIESATPK